MTQLNLFDLFQYNGYVLVLILLILQCG